MAEPRWTDLGPVRDFEGTPVREFTVDRTKLAITWKDGELGAISAVCNHVGGPLGQGTLAGDYVVCPWHGWKFQWQTGFGEPGFEDDRVPAYDVKLEGGRVFVAAQARTTRNRLPHAPHPLACLFAGVGR